MSKIKRKAHLSRGSKLVPGHVFTDLETMATGLDRSIEQEQLQTGHVPFRVNHWIPYIDSSFPRDADRNNVFSIPFHLPPLQDTFAFQTDLAGKRIPTLDADTPELVLDEISISFDQRGEPGGIVDFFWDGDTAGDDSEGGKLDFSATALDSMAMQVTLFAKPQFFFTDDPDLGATREIVTLDLPADAFSGRNFRTNPAILTGINKTVSPYETLILGIRCPGLSDYATPRLKTYALANFLASMRFRHPLVSRSTGIQNQPTKHSGAKQAPDISIDAPLAGTAIRAEGDQGVSTNIEIIDEVFRGKLDGGMDSNSEVEVTANLAVESTYDVLCVPLFSGRKFGGIRADDVTGEPYVSGNTSTLADRRIIPLDYPFEIHHVTYAHSWQRWIPSTGTAATVPSSSTLKCEVGVALGTGMRGDYSDYQQVAFTSLEGPQSGGTWGARHIDYVRTSEQPASRLSSPHWDWELHQVPLVGSNGQGYYAQGEPIYVGRAWTPTQARENLNGGSSIVAGQEQFLEVRCHISDSAGILVTADSGAQTAGDILVGYGGSFVYVIGKKPLVA